MSERLHGKTRRELADAAPAACRLLHEDSRTRITQWTFAPGTQTGWHRHELDYVTVQQSGGELALHDADGAETRVPYRDGRTMSWKAPVEHNAVNVSDVEVRVLEIEYKPAGSPGGEG